MNAPPIIEKFQNIKVWTRGDQRAPHKPLLLLIALSRLQQNQPRLASFEDVEPVLRTLLIEFGPNRTSYHPEYPFQRLVRDGVWELSNFESLVPRRGSSDAPKSQLLKYHVAGGFTSEVFETLNNDPKLVAQVAQVLLEEAFPSSYHQAILTEVGLDLEIVGLVKKKRRDPRFRETVIRAYQRRCAVCHASVQIGSELLAIEAAHIKWHQASGPDTAENGLALCAVHHRLFDRGAFTVSENQTILVSEHANGNHGFLDWLLQFHGKQIAEPVNPAYRPKADFLRWHLREVFRGPERFLFMDRVAEEHFES